MSRQLRTNAVIEAHFVCLSVEPVEISGDPSPGPGRPASPSAFVLEACAHLVSGEELITYFKRVRSWDGTVVWMRRLAPGEDRAAAEQLARRMAGDLPETEHRSLAAAGREAAGLRQRFDRDGQVAKMEAYLGPLLREHPAQPRPKAETLARNGHAAGRRAADQELRRNGSDWDVGGVVAMVTNLQVKPRSDGMLEAVIAKAHRRVYADLIANLSFVTGNGTSARVEERLSGFYVIVYGIKGYHGERAALENEQTFKLHIMRHYWGPLSAFVEGFQRGYAEGYGARNEGLPPAVSSGHRHEKYPSEYPFGPSTDHTPPARRR